MVEKRIAVAAFAFAIVLIGVIALTVRVFGVEVPDCVVDVQAFRQGNVVEKAPKRYEVHYVARMWKFDPPEITLAPGSTADIYLSTPDVVHGAQIVGTNFNLMAVPGAVNYARVKFDKEGDYLVVCNEYCGTSHHNMAAVIHVSAKAAAPPPPPPPPAALPGRDVIETYGCTACHSIDGSVQAAPTFKGLYGSRRVLIDGSTVTADDNYLRESIEKPEAKHVKGFESNMPEMPLTPAEVQSIIDYLKTLK
ncbi:MAG: c-type cytochrome [Thermoanaerobaculia bacterium]